MNRILIVDLSAVLHAVKHSLGKHKLSYDEEPTFVIYGFLLKLQLLKRKTRANILAFATDSKDSKRKVLYEQYKADRHKNKTPEQEKLDGIAFPQFELVENYVIPTLGYRNVLHAPGLEGDDVIGRLCKDYKDEEIIIVGNDKDLYQLLRNNICMFNPLTNGYYTDRDFKKQYSIKPIMWKRVKAIGGCSSDNVKGVPIPQPDPNKKQIHVAEKGAINYLTGKMKPTTLAYKAIESEAGKKIINRNKALVILPHRSTPHFKLRPHRFQKAGLQEVCEKYGFNSILKYFEDWCRDLR